MAENDKTAAEGQQADPSQGQFGIRKVYVKDLSFETPNSPSVFNDQASPNVNLQLANESSKLADNTYEVVLRLTVTVATDDKTYYLAEVNQAGIFHIGGFPDNAVSRMLATVCPNILFPFARELVSDLVTRGGFPQLLLSPVNFEALYAQQQKQQEPQAATDSGQQTTH
ncbi:preprotein translocase subunit SecB [Methylohalomonas lacus]|uniref:Protein-export protein SecB n=1 Tax=Methylohalomonas lacus TaxID=398773 RepID=A0AAE3L5S7_9GAMM|nr:protein-export chaperone SecB [Methylohalomonas lacus]MCS3903942.1 preprotein translocase subunit SecB [Methylohalomonas lacus]